MEAAWDLGIRYFDTAPFYGYGLSEERLGAVLRSRPRDEYVLSTKVGRLVRAGPSSEGPGIFRVPPTRHCVWDFGRDGILRSVEDSLRRLGLDRVDVLFVHDADDHWQEVVESAFPALAELRAQGVVRGIGFGMNRSDLLARYVRHTDPDIVIAANSCTLLRRDAYSDLLPVCRERGVDVVAASVFHQGLLTSMPGADAPAPVRRIGAACARHGVPITAAAMRFPLRHPAVRRVLVGAHTPDQIRADVEAFEHPIPEKFWAAVE